MNQQLTPVQLAEINTIAMSRRERLFRFARVIRQCDRPHLFMFSNLEYLHPDEMSGLQHPNSAFAVAAEDAVLKDAGLKDGTVKEAQRFFDLSRSELHVFSCDCGGHLSNEQTARRIEMIAAGA